MSFHKEVEQKSVRLHITFSRNMLNRKTLYFAEYDLVGIYYLSFLPDDKMLEGVNWKHL